MIPIRLVGKGSYQAFAMFLHKLRQEFSDMALWSMELSRPDVNRPGEVTFRMRVIWFASIELRRDRDPIPTSQPTDSKPPLGGVR